MSKARLVIEAIAAKIDVRLDGKRPEDIIVHDERLFDRIIKDGSLGFGEAYMDGWWDCKALDKFFNKVFRAHVDKEVTKDKGLVFSLFLTKFFNFQTKKRAYQVADAHYNLGNDLYFKMLDKNMAYSCGYWEGTKSLDTAQAQKLDLICRKIGLKKGMKVLDIGCGWGSMAKFAAEKYGVEVVGVTISKEQQKYGMERCKGLPVDLRLQDYRDVAEKFDRIISIGMFEHVGHKNYREYFEVVNRCLKDDGLFCLHTIGQDDSVTSADPWVHKYIFPNGMVPSIQQVGKASENLFVMEDWHNFGQYYDITLMAWWDKFKKAWPELKVNYDERFYRMWEYYLKVFAGNFRARNLQLWQIVYSKNGVEGVYKTVR